MSGALLHSCIFVCYPCESLVPCRPTLLSRCLCLYSYNESAIVTKIVTHHLGYDAMHSGGNVWKFRRNVLFSFSVSNIKNKQQEEQESL
jgi:hypothetical protein